MISVSLLLEYLLNIDHQAFLWGWGGGGVGVGRISELVSYQHCFVLDAFSDAMLCFLFRVGGDAVSVRKAGSEPCTVLVVCTKQHNKSNNIPLVFITKYNPCIQKIKQILEYHQ